MHRSELVKVDGMINDGSEAIHGTGVSVLERSAALRARTAVVNERDPAIAQFARAVCFPRCVSISPVAGAAVDLWADW